MGKNEKKIIEFFEKNYIIISFIFITVIAIIVRGLMFPYKTDDFNSFLNPWFQYLKTNGGLTALKDYPGDYNAPYMTILALFTYLPLKGLTLIKLFSSIFDFVLAISSALLIKEIVPKKKEILTLVTYTAVLFTPSVLLNSALWAQSDSIYTSFCILSLLCLIKKKYRKAFIFLGLSFSIKLQFIFLLPLYIVYYVREKKFSILNFLWIPTVNIVLSLPAIIFGKPIKDIFLVYLNQANEYKDFIVLNFPNIYQIFRVEARLFYPIGTILTITVCFCILIYTISNKVKFNPKKILLLGLFFVVITTYLLPGMHERYLYMGEILCMIYFILYRKNLPLLLFIITTTLITYTRYLFDGSFTNLPLLSLIYFVIIAYFTKYTLKELIN